VLDFPAAALALWTLFDQGGPRPEYVLPVLYAESGFDPSTPNLAGAPYYGINQASASLIASYAGTDPQTYMMWSASQQIATVVSGMLRSIVSSYGPLRSGVRVDQANIAPSTLPSARALGDAIYRFPDAGYTGNKLLDVENKGAITLSDLARFITPKTAAGRDALAAAIARTYEERPAERPRDPTFGEDFRGGGGAAFAVGAAGAFLLYAWKRG
jgi:hypothetical protein